MSLRLSQVYYILGGRRGIVPSSPGCFSPDLIALFCITLFRIDKNEWKIDFLKLNLCNFCSEAL